VSEAAQARLDALGRTAIERRIPLNGSLAMTHRCHLRCVHCYLGPDRYAPPEGGERDTAFWLSVLDQVAEAGCLNLLVTGGEPLVRPDFADVYAHAVRLGILVSVFTNGTLVGERELALFTELPPQLVEITLYGATAEVYEGVTGSAGSFERCLRGVDALLGRGVPVGLKAMVLSGNQHEIPRMREMARERGVDFRIDPAVFPTVTGDEAPLAHRIPAAEAIAIEMEDEGLRGRTADYYERVRGQASGSRLFTCLAGVTGFHVDATGTLFPCLMVSTHGFDLRRGTFREGWDGLLARFSDQEVAAGYECHTCELRFLCGHCPAQAALETGSPHVRAEYMCRLGEARLGAIEPGLDSEEGVGDP
jgi:radical SAM protein with 4Fe4S-binding SPASM domain